MIPDLSAPTSRLMAERKKHGEKCDCGECMAKAKVELASKIDVEEALKEVTSKTKQEIEIETARKWAARAIACHQLMHQAKKMHDKLKWADLADDFRQEAMEHAAVADDDGVTLADVTKAMNKVKEEAAADPTVKCEGSGMMLASGASLRHNKSGPEGKVYVECSVCHKQVRARFTTGGVKLWNHHR